MSESNSPPSSDFPTHAVLTNPKPTPTVAFKQTARMRTMGKSMAGKQLAPPSAPLHTPTPLGKRRRNQPSPASSSSEEQEEDDPEDEDGYDFGPRPLKRKVKDESEDDSDDDSGNDSDEGYLGAGIDESDEEELGDQGRRSPNCTESCSMNKYNSDTEEIATPAGDDI